MNKDLFLYTVLPYLLLIVILTVIITLKIDGCNKPEYIPNTRDSVLQSKVDSLTKEIQAINQRVQITNDLLLINETGINQNRVYYGKKKDEIKKQSANEDYNQINNYLNNIK
jgi:hypothetical protein